MSPLVHLLKPLQLGGGTVGLSNRVVMSALTRNRSIPTNVPNHLNTEYYEQRAAGGTGMIITEGTLIAQQGSEWPNAPGIWNQEQVNGWKKVTDAVHKHKSKIFCQLWHLGRISHPDAPEQKASGEPVYAPSAIAARGGKFKYIEGEPGYVTPTAIDDPRELIAKFKQAAINAKEAGFDGVELHGASGYLVHQFLDSTANKRTDEWGGSKENRSRFGLEALKELVSVFGPGRVGMKLSPCGGYNDVGMSLEETIDTYSYYIQEADQLDLAYIFLSRYSDRVDVTIDGKLRATQHDVVATYGPLIKRATFILNVGLTPDEANDLIGNGTIDAAAFGFPFIANPDFVSRIENGKEMNMDVDFEGVYGNGSLDWDYQKKGYTTYPFATHVKV